MGVWVGEEAGLEDWIRGGFDAGDHVRRGEGNLLHLGKVVFAIAVEGEFAKATERNFLLRPYLCEIEDVPSEFFSLLWRKDLQVTGPTWVIAVLDSVEKVLSMPIRVFGGHIARFGIGKCLTALIRLAMNLHVVECAVWLGELVRMS